MALISNYYKYLIMLFTSLLIIAISLGLTYLAFQYAGVIGGAFVGLVCFAVFIGIVLKFVSTGLTEYTFEEAVMNEGAKFDRQVIIKDPEYGLVWFNKKGKIVPSQRGTYFFYGYPFLFGHKTLLINSLNTEEIAGNPIIIEGNHPHEYPDMLYIETNHPIVIKGGEKEFYLEAKSYSSGLEIWSRHGKSVREAIASRTDTKIANVSLDELTRPEY